MARVKGGARAHARHKKVIKQAKKVISKSPTFILLLLTREEIL